MDKRLKMQPTEVSVKDMIMEKMELENKVFDLESQLAALRERAGRLEGALQEVSEIRHRIIRHGNIHWSRDIYPLVSILDSALSTPAPAGEPSHGNDDDSHYGPIEQLATDLGRHLVKGLVSGYQAACPDCGGTSLRDDGDSVFCQDCAERVGYCQVTCVSAPAGEAGE